MSVWGIVTWNICECGRLRAGLICIFMCLHSLARSLALALSFSLSLSLSRQRPMESWRPQPLMPQSLGIALALTGEGESLPYPRQR